MVPDRRWVFADRRDQTAAVLSTNSVVIEQTHYTSFEPFLETLARAVETIAASVDVDLCERLGFRRVNLIEPGSSGLAPRDFLQPGLRGLGPSALSFDQLRAQLEERGRTLEGDLVVGMTTPAPDGGLPPDLGMTLLKRRGRRDETGESALLDIDHFSTQERDFTGDAVVDGFWKLHQRSDEAFRAAVTSEALGL